MRDGNAALKHNDEFYSMDEFIEKLKAASKLVMLELEGTCKKADAALEKLKKDLESKWPT